MSAVRGKSKRAKGSEPEKGRLMREAAIKYQPHSLQRKAHESVATNILFGGAVGGGKSVCLVNDALFRSLWWEGNRVGIFRWEYASFMKTTWKTMEEWIFGVPHLVSYHNEQKKLVRLCNGSEIFYGGLKPASMVSGDPLTVVKSLELSSVYLDEVTDFPENVFAFLPSRVGRVKCRNGRTGKMEFPPPRIMCSCNPALGWVKLRWVDPPQLPDHIFIRSRVADNPHLGSEYEARLREMWAHSPQDLERYLDGNWDAVVDYEAVCPAPWLTRAATSTLYRPKPEDTIQFGVDIGAYGSDKSVVIKRTGMRAEILFEVASQSTKLTASQIMALADNHHPASIVVDSIGVGQGVYDMLNDAGYPVFGFIGGARPRDKRFLNLRAESYWGFRNLLEKGMVDIPNNATLLNDIGVIRYLCSASDKVIQVESKENIRKRLGKSPDYADALIYAFYGEGWEYGVGGVYGVNDY